ncbi:hypothetical protein PGTUg99_022886 [Puccinia graminis f. sp. tritici]|uniref:Uncharacterized protein n=1 Tax=Puccinia graminis f. sp. tritici TaxID=56615 RepID=A0A5B0Q4K0_PUCGR|nr:hypothetical protein PGTUg99_022886 [Puccinia graminis f. sp. tritici]
MNIPTVPSLGSISSPGNPGRVLVLDFLFDDQAILTDLLSLVLSHQYLNSQIPGRTQDEYDLGQLFDMRDDDFKQAVRTMW